MLTGFSGSFKSGRRKSRITGLFTNNLLLWLDAADTTSYPGSGTAVYDISGNGHTHTLTDAPLTTIDGIKCFDCYSNTTGVIACNVDGPVLPSSGFTYIAWAKLKPSSSSWRTLFRTTPDDHPLLINTGGTTLGMYDNNNGIGFVSTGRDITGDIDRWAQWTVVGDSSGQTFYIDDQLVGTTANNTSGNRHKWISLNGQSFGYIANAFLYGTKLSAKEVAQMYNTLKTGFSVSTNNLIVHIDAGNERSYAGSETTAFDLSGNSNDFTIVGSPTFSSTQGWIFDAGSINKYMLKNPISVPTTTATYEIWLKTTTTASAGIISYAAGPGSTLNNDALIFSPSNVAFYVANSSISTGIAVNDGNWKQLVRTSNRTTGEEILYINGVRVWSGTLAAGTPFTTGGSLMLAQDQDTVAGGLDPAQAFGGNIAILRVYDKVLLPGEVSSNFNSQRARFGL